MGEHFFDLPELSEKQRFRKPTNRLCWGVFLYSVVFTVFSIIMMFGYTFIGILYQLITGQDVDVDKISDYIDRSDCGMGIAVLIACLVMTCFMKKSVRPADIFRRKRKMTPALFLMILMVFMGIQLPATILDSLFETVLNIIGFTEESAIENASADSSTITMFLYAGIIGPFAEEFIYRGYAMDTYEKAGGGKVLAIVMSAFLFGVMHGNPAQIPFAAVVGLVLGYTAMEYGIVWTIILHILNNMVFGDLLNYALGMLPEELSSIVEMLILIGFFIGCIAVLIAKRRNIAAYIRENSGEGKYFRWAFTSVPLMIFTVVNIITAVCSIDRMAE